MTAKHPAFSPYAVGMLVGLLMLSTAAWAQVKVEKIHTFTGSTQNGNVPTSKLVYRDGRLYGSTAGGTNSCACGTLFELSPTPTGWNYKTLYDFTGGHDGANPNGNLVFDANGNLYGTTYAGGNAGQGVIYQLAAVAGASWTESIIYRFQGQPDGASPAAGLTIDAAGNLFGATLLGGAYGQGAAYELTPQSDGSWSESVLFSFNGQNQNAAYPHVELARDSAGNLFGTTNRGGTHNEGTVFELTFQSGAWTEQLLYSFIGGEDGGLPDAAVWADSADNVYGTATTGGNGYGTAFVIAHAPDGSWDHRTIHVFNGFLGDGATPTSALTGDTAGNLYGTTFSGGQFGGGIVYRLSRKSNGEWADAVVYSFRGGGSMWPNPIAGVTFGKGGTAFGTTMGGGFTVDAAIYELKQ